MKMNISSELKILKKEKKYLLYIIYAFTFFIILGLIFPNFFLKAQQQLFDTIIQKLDGQPTWYVSAFIFQNNVKSAAMAAYLGIFFLIVPIFSISLNGYIIGAVMHRAIAEKGIITIWKLLPHGIFELPALLISFYLGIKLFFALFKNKGKDFPKTLKENTKIFLKIVIPLLLIAAIIEGILFNIFV